jgi:hypothetical protein
MLALLLLLIAFPGLKDSTRVAEDRYGGFSFSYGFHSLDFVRGGAFFQQPQLADPLVDGTRYNGLYSRKYSLNSVPEGNAFQIALNRTAPLKRNPRLSVENRLSFTVGWATHTYVSGREYLSARKVESLPELGAGIVLDSLLVYKYNRTSRAFMGSAGGAKVLHIRAGKRFRIYGGAGISTSVTDMDMQYNLEKTAIRKLTTLTLGEGQTAPGPYSSVLSQTEEKTYLSNDSNWENPVIYQKAFGLGGTVLAGCSIPLNPRGKGLLTWVFFLEHEYTFQRHFRRSEGHFSTSGFQARYGIRLQRKNGTHHSSGGGRL